MASARSLGRGVLARSARASWCRSTIVIVGAPSVDDAALAFVPRRYLLLLEGHQFFVQIAIEAGAATEFLIGDEGIVIDAVDFLE